MPCKAKALTVYFGVSGLPSQTYEGKRVEDPYADLQSRFDEDEEARQQDKTDIP